MAKLASLAKPPHPSPPEEGGEGMKRVPDMP